MYGYGQDEGLDVRADEILEVWPAATSMKNRFVTDMRAVLMR